MKRVNFEDIVRHIVSESVRLKDKYAEETNVKVEFCDIFSRDEDEYQQLIEVINKLGTVVYQGPTGNIYSLKDPIETIAGPLHLVKIRKADNKLRLRGDADFDTDYINLKQKYLNHPHFELIIREKFEMLRLSDPDFDVMTCFSNIPVRNWI